MSNALAIATVTRAIHSVVEQAAGSVVSGAQVLMSRPDANAAGGARIHLFLYQALPDPSQRNNDLPSRASDGTVRQRPTAALTLRYLLTFNGDDSINEPHKMLGAVAAELHSRAALPRGLIQSVSTGDLSTSDLAQAVDIVRLVPLTIDTDELSKLWLMFSQIPYSLSVAYEAGVVLIEADDTPTPVLPVLYRGAGDRGPSAQLGPYPALEDYEITLPGAPLSGPRLPPYPAAQLGLQIALQGRNLGGDSVTVRFTHPRLGDLDVAIADTDRSAEQIRVAIPNDLASETAYAPGVYLVSARVTSGGATRASNVIPIPFALDFALPPSPIPGAGTDLALAVTCRPQVAADQRVELMIAGSETILVPPAQTGNLAFTILNAPAVTNVFVHLRVDGVDSFVFKQQAAPPKFVLDDSKRITIT